MHLSALDLNRTLLARQHLLERKQSSVSQMAHHLIGLQAQENLSPFLSLAARIEAFVPETVTLGLSDKSLVRLLCLRGTVHLLVPEDALMLRQWTQPAQARERKSSQPARAAVHLPADVFDRAVRDALAEGPLSGKDLGLTLAATFPGVPPTALTNLARIDLPLAQLPPRGGWRQPGGVVYQYVDRWLEFPHQDPDAPAIVRRYLAAFGPATAADVTAWSGTTRMGPALKAMGDLVTHTDEIGRTLYDVPGAPLVRGDHPAPVRLLGTYDNLWLSHAGRDRTTCAQARKRWMGPSGGTGKTIFVDGWLTGLWRVDGGRIRTEVFRELTSAEQRALDTEVERTETFLAR